MSLRPRLIGPLLLALVGAACDGRDEARQTSVPRPASPAPSSPASARAPSPPPEVASRWPVPASLRGEHRQLAAALRKGLPKASGDYSEALAAVMLIKRKRLTVAELGDVLAERGLPSHRLGDAYLLTPSPSPPPGMAYDPAVMPADWEDTWGEVAMAYHLGELTRAQYDTLHQAAHPRCPR